MPPKEYNEHELVKMCLAELCTKTGFLSAESLVQRDMLHLCETIESKTGVSISLSTIKRLLNGQFARLPQIATLDAIATSSGYHSWQDFIITKNQKAGTPTKTSPRPFLKLRYIALGIFLILAIGLLAIIIPNKHGIGNVDKAKFSVTKVTGNDIPNTVIFKYDIDGVVADSFFIQQSWDQNRRIRIYKNSHTLTDIYYEPGWHNAKLIANDKIIKIVPVSIPTDRWLFYVKDNTPKGEPKYITPANTPKNTLPNLTVSDIENGKIDVQKSNAFIESYFPSDIRYSSDNFVMKSE